LGKRIIEEEGVNRSLERIIKNYINMIFKTCTAYRILLVVEIKRKKSGGPCSTYGGYKIQIGFNNFSLE